MKSSGYDARVFSVSVSSSRSIFRVTSSNTTFSSTVPNRWVVEWICGSALAERRIAFA